MGRQFAVLDELLLHGGTWSQSPSLRVGVAVHNDTLNLRKLVLDLSDNAHVIAYLSNNTILAGDHVSGAHLRNSESNSFTCTMLVNFFES